jgi:hypothetical protein
MIEAQRNRAPGKLRSVDFPWLRRLQAFGECTARELLPHELTVDYGLLGKGCPMNIDSEIRHFSQLSALEQSRFIARFMYELTLEARNFYGPGGEQAIDANKLRFINEIQHRLTRFIEQILIDDPARPTDEVMWKLVLAPRAEKTIENLVHAAYARTIEATA